MVVLMVKIAEVNRAIVPLCECHNDNGDLFNGYVLKNIQNGLYYLQVEDKKPNNLLVDRVSLEFIENRFHKITCSNVDIDEWGLNKEMLLNGQLKHEDDISMTQIERNMLFNFIKKIKPRSVMEFSPFHGFSTVTICSALMEVGIRPTFFETHEIEKENIRLTEYNLYENNVDYVKVIPGDVFQTLDREKLKEVDFLFIDSDHSGAFARRYINEFFPLLKDGCWVAIHDIACDIYFRSEEAVEVLKYLKDTAAPTFFHIEDLMKMYRIVDKNYIWSNSRNTLLFWQVKK